MFVYVLNKEGKPLMPTNPAKARILLKLGKAKVVRSLPFTIKLTYDSPNYVQTATGGMDTGSTVVGSAVISNGKVLYQAEVTLRQDISGTMEQRAMYRRNRRGRKTRYRECRFKNRANSRRKGRLAPSLRSKLVHRFLINSRLDCNSTRHFIPFFHFISPRKRNRFFVNLIYILTNSFI